MESVELSSAQVEQTLTERDSHIISDDYRLVPRLNKLSGDERYWFPLTPNARAFSR